MSNLTEIFVLLKWFEVGAANEISWWWIIVMIIWDSSGNTKYEG